LLEIFFKINSKKNKKFVPNNFRMGSSKTWT
jgi:hypothetical protein